MLVVLLGAAVILALCALGAVLVHIRRLPTAPTRSGTGRSSGGGNSVAESPPSFGGAGFDCSDD